MDNLKSFFVKRTVLTILLIVVALLSIFVIAKIVTQPSFNAKTIEALDDKKIAVTSLAATAAATSTAISLIPGDVAMPVANEIAELGGYFIIILCAIILEKVLIAVIGHVTFVYIIPAACFLILLYLYLQKDFLLKMGIKLAIFGVVIFVAIPASIYVSNMVESTHQQSLDQALETAQENKEFIEDKKNDLADEDENWMDKVGNYLSNLSSKIGAGVSDIVQKAEDTLNSLLDSIAILIITSCIIPIIVILLFIWIIKILFGFEIKVPTNHPMLPKRFRGHDNNLPPSIE